MRVELVVEGRPRVLEVDLGGGTVREGELRLPFFVLRATEDGVELEIAGERVAVAGWPEGREQPLAGLAINGERVAARVVARSSGTLAATVPAPTAAGAPPAPAAPPGGPDGPGVAIRPPMPGKVLEVRVREGDRVAPGQVLLVVEAMKMRNEITAPAAGVVRALAVAVGANVAARTTMLRVVLE